MHIEIEIEREAMMLRTRRKKQRKRQSSKEPREREKYLRPFIVWGKRAEFVETMHQIAKTIPFTPYLKGTH